MDIKDILSAVSALLAMCFVIFAAYYTTRFIAEKARPGYKSAQCLKLIDRFVISRDKMIIVVSMGQCAYVIGVTGQNMTLIDTITMSDLPPEDTQKVPPAAFADVMTMLRGKIGAFKSGKDDSSGGEQ